MGRDRRGCRRVPQQHRLSDGERGVRLGGRFDDGWLDRRRRRFRGRFCDRFQNRFGDPSGELVGHVRPFNVVVSNVPGPRIPLYASGAEMLHYYPFAPVVDGLGLNISLFSYAGQIEFGLNACRELVPDIGDLCTMLHDSFDELRAATGV